MTEWIELLNLYPGDGTIVVVKAESEVYGIGIYTARSGFECVRYDKKVNTGSGWIKPDDITHYKIVEEAK